MKKTVLVIDDFDNTRFVIKFTLQQENYEILEAVNGKDAMKYLDGRKIDLIVSDLNMPEMDGIQFTKEVRNYPAYATIPILMLTTEISDEKRRSAYEAGITGWVKKPFNMQDFMKMVKKVI